MQLLVDMTVLLYFLQMMKENGSRIAQEGALRSQPNNSSIWRTTFVQNFPFKTIIQYRDVTVSIIINVIINTVIQCFNTVAVCQ